MPSDVGSFCVDSFNNGKDHYSEFENSVTKKNSSYQHVQGVMLLQLNKLASKLKLSHTDYRVMGTLIGLYNKSCGRAFPTIDQLANYCCMGKSTILKSLNDLVKLNLLVVVKTPGKRNNYYFSNLILSGISTPHVELPDSTPCKTAHDKEHIKNKTDREQTLSNKTHDDVSKAQLIKENGQLLTKLKSWGVIDAKKLISNHSIQKLRKVVEVVENKKPCNYGAYLRSLLNLPDIIITDKSIRYPQLSDQTLIKQMLEHQYWQHIPTGKVLRVKPDVGDHILIKYYKQDNLVQFIEDTFCDILTNFKPIESII